MCQISARSKHVYTGYSDFCKACEKKKNETKKLFCKLLVSQESLKDFSSNLECGLLIVEGIFIVNLVQYGSDNTELQMRENC